MNEKVKNLDFSKVDWSKYQDELNEIYQTYNELKKDKRFMRKLIKIKSKDRSNRKWLLHFFGKKLQKV